MRRILKGEENAKRERLFEVSRAAHEVREAEGLSEPLLLGWL